MINTYYSTALICFIVLSGCAPLHQDWRLNEQDGDLRYFTRQSTTASLPEFKATITVQAPLSEVMMLITDFSRHPEWVYGCKQISIIALQSYTEAHLYQVTALPVIRDRDMILHASTHSDEQGKKIRIQLRAAPLYCDDNPDEDCEAINNSPYVRVSEAEGVFVLTRVDHNVTHIEWTQFLDPGGDLPHWLFRAALSQVPMKSLRQLKSLTEKDEINP